MHPAVDQTRTYRGQVYKCVDVFEHVTRDGRDITLLSIRSRCADCCCLFEITETSRNFRRRNLLRRCEHCRRAGAPVAQVRRNRKAHTGMSPVQRQMHRVLVALAEKQKASTPDAQGWVRAEDWIRALVEQGVFDKTETAGKGPYYHMRGDMLRRGLIQKRRAAVRALDIPS